MITTTATKQSLQNAINTVFVGQISQLDTANKYLERYLNDLPMLYSKLGKLAGGVDFSRLVALYNASPTEQAVRTEIADALAVNTITSSDIAYQVRVGNTGTQLSTDANNLTDGMNELVDFLAVLTEGGTYQYPYTGGTLAYNQMSAGANLVGTMLSAGAKITRTQLSQGANIVGSQLSARAGIVSEQITDGTIVDADISNGAAISGSKLASNSVTGSQLSAGAKIVGTQLSTGANIVGGQLSAGANIIGTQLSADAKIIGSQLSAYANIVGSQLSANADIFGSQIRTNTVTSNEILDGTLLNADIAIGAEIQYIKLALGVLVCI